MVRIVKTLDQYRFNRIRRHPEEWEDLDDRELEQYILRIIKKPRIWVQRG